jgi:hypothetical protein
MLSLDFLWRTTLSATCVAAIGFGVAQAYGRTTATNAQSNPQRGRAMNSMMVDERQAGAMVAERQQMMERMQSFDRKLNELVAKMDTAQGAQKADAIAAVVKELAAGRTQLNEEMLAMQQRMMGHMMQHMTSMHGSMMGMMNRGAGHTGTAGQPMESCPMMKGLGNETALGEGDHDTHHSQEKK